MASKKVSQKKKREARTILLLMLISAAVLTSYYVIISRLMVCDNERIAMTDSILTPHASTEKPALDSVADVPSMSILYDVPIIASPLVALIIDDFGPGLNSKLVRGFMDLPFNITISIIPGNSHSAKVGKMADRAGKEVFIHLPMEPLDSVSMNEPDMVYADVDSLTLHEILERVVSELPQASGMNNHMGSKATLNEGLMAMLAVELSVRNWVFIDSRTVPHSRALSAMRKAKVPANGRDIFLDLTLDKNYIYDQLETTVNIARRRGWSIGIGHVRKKTLSVLREALPEYESEGIRFVFVTELLASIEHEIENSVVGSNVLP